MKIRNGFVSNSSSSSFIVSSKDTPKIVLEIDLEKLSSVKIKTQEELDKFFSDEFNYPEENDEYYAELYNKSLESLLREEIVYFGEVYSDDNNPASTFLYERGLSGQTNFNVIQDL